MKNETEAARDAAFEKYVNGDQMDVCLGRFSEESFIAGWNARGGQWVAVSKTSRPTKNGWYVCHIEAYYPRVLWWTNGGGFYTSPGSDGKDARLDVVAYFLVSPYTASTDADGGTK